MGTESWHLKEVNARLTDDLLDQDVVQVLRWNQVSFIVLLVVEHIESEAASLCEDLIDEELVLFIGVGEVNDLLAVIIDVSLVIISVFDRLLWVDKLADVNGAGARELLQMVSQVLKVVAQVVSLADAVFELGLLALD